VATGHPGSVSDWHLTWQQPGFTQTPEVDWGTDPVDPLQFSGSAPGLVDDVNPVGATDAAIARTFGWSTRTVQRRVQQLMAQVGARTRFQIGMEAAHRGWI
jgi:hypothetical protein